MLDLLARVARNGRRVTAMEGIPLAPHNPKVPEDLEQKGPKDTSKGLVIFVSSDGEEQATTPVLKASPTWTEGDNLFVIYLVAAG